METPGQRIRRIREEKRLTAQQLAEMVGVSRPHITQVENGKKGVSAELLRELERTMGASADWVLFGKGEMFQKDAENVSSASASAQDFEEFVRMLAGRHPDIVLHLRSIIRNQNALTENDRKAMIDLISIAMAQASGNIQDKGGAAKNDAETEHI